MQQLMIQTKVLHCCHMTYYVAYLIQQVAYNYHIAFYDILHFCTLVCFALQNYTAKYISYLLLNYSIQTKALPRDSEQ